MSAPRKFKVEYGCQELCSVEIDERDEDEMEMV